MNFNADSSANIRLWAPNAEEVQLKLIRQQATIPLERLECGYWQTKTHELKPGDFYKFCLNGEKELPDPASLSQPEGVHESSVAFDLQSFIWSDHSWQNPLLDDYILYELHTGTFTDDRNFAGIRKKLKYLKELGINAIEIMPVAQFPGDRNWGYDGVFPFAVQHSYGGAAALMELVDACHREGIAVVLDVVYNHLGPEGNYFAEYGPYFTEKYKTPWGGAINFDDAHCDPVRNYFIENALMWFRDFHIDGLRLDAVHAIKDFSALHVLKEIRIWVDELMKQTGRIHYLIVELDLNDTRYISPLHEGGYGMDCQWVDEFHHALRVAAGGERNGYYSDFKGVGDLAKAYADAYVYDGQYSQHRKKKFGIKTWNRAGKQFIVFSQNHDQVGNRMLGERTSQLVSFEMQKLMAAAVFVSPFLPMLFMGEEWSEPNPFQYFVSHTDPVLAEAVRKGRKEEFAAFHLEGDAPDPMAEDTFRRSSLSWDLQMYEPHQTMLQYYKALIRLRKENVVLKHPSRDGISVQLFSSENSLAIFRHEEEESVMVIMNFSESRQSFQPLSDKRQWWKLFDSADAKWNGPGESMESHAFSIDDTITIQSESVIIYSNRHV